MNGILKGGFITIHIPPEVRPGRSGQDRPLGTAGGISWGRAPPRPWQSTAYGCGLVPNTRGPLASAESASRP